MGGAGADEGHAGAADGIRLVHIGLCVSDLERSIAFYRDALGMEEFRRLEFEGDPTATLLGLDDLAVDLVYLERDGLRLELIGYRRPDALDPTGPRPMNLPGFTHLSVFVQDYDAAISRVEQFGGRIVDGSAVTFEWGNRGIMALDPDGVRVELIEERPA